MRTGWIRTFAFITAFSILLIVAPGVDRAASQGNGSNRAELHPNFLILDPASPIDQGRLVNIETILENTGEATANAFRVEFFIRNRSESETTSWTSFAVDEISGLAPDEQEISARAVLDTTNSSLIPDPGVYEIRVVVDSNNQIPELDESNNELITSISVQASKLGLPDLRAQMVMFSPPSPISQNEVVEVLGDIINQGDDKAAAFMVQFSYCKVVNPLNPTTCSTEYVEFALNEDEFLGGLSKGGELSTKATLPALEPGTYLVRMLIDPPTPHAPAGMIEEQDEANNELIVLFSIQGPELHVTGLEFEPTLPRVGDTISVAATVFNTGQIKAQNAEVAFFVDGAQFDQKTISLADSQSMVVRGTLSTLQQGLEAGVHSIRIVVDPLNLISERDETNNETLTGITLLQSIPAFPELRPKGIRLTPSSPIQRGLNPTLGVEVEIINTGESLARDIDIEFSFRSTGSVRWQTMPCVTNCSVPSLAAGELYKANADLLLFNIDAGTYELRAIVDPSNRIQELDELNNEIYTSFTILATRLPDLLIDPLNVVFDPSLTERRGTPVDLTFDVINFGEEIAGPFDVEVSLAQINTDNTLGDAIASQRLFVNGLGIGERATLEVPLETDIKPGFYQVIVTVDPDNRVNELDELNNLFITGPLFVRGPDLIGSPRFVEPTGTIFEPRLNPGDELIVALDIVNIGIEAAGEFEVDFCIQGIGEDGLDSGPCVAFGDEIKFPGLGIGKPVEASATIDTSTLAGGRYSVRMTIDPVSQGLPCGWVEEENENNNASALTIEILGDGDGTAGSGTGDADLTVMSLTLNPPFATFGQIIETKAKIGNFGSEDAENFRVVFFYKRVGQDQLFNFAQFSVPKLRPGESLWFTGNLNTALLGVGDFEIIVIVDFNEEVDESNEQNNRSSQQLIVT
jgi:subtilase family serine protease